MIKHSLSSLLMVHRTEKNATPWSKERLKSLLKDLEIETDEGRICIEEWYGIGTAFSRLFFREFEA